jgi:predicted signal transduction protein with EAL and GGDEF domain
MTLLIACAVAVLVIVAAVAVTVLARRSSKRSDTRVAELVDNLNTRIDELAKELAGAREQAEGELRRNRVLSDLGGSIDLDEVLTRTLEAATHATDSDAALVWIGNAAGPPLVATLGLTQEEAERQAIAGPPNGRRARAIGISYRYDDGEISQNGDLIRSGLAVPMPLIPDADVERYLAVFTRDEAELGDDSIEELEQLAQRAGPAIENAQRFQEARQLADLDALTGLHNRRYFHETLAREVARAHRYNRDLALVVFDLDGRGGPRARRRAHSRHRVPRRGRRVRGRAPGGVAPRCRTALPADPARGLCAADRGDRPHRLLGRRGRATPGGRLGRVLPAGR